MNPTDCSVVVVYGHRTDPSTISLLRSVHGHGNVAIATTDNEALDKLQQRNGSAESTLLLIDMGHHMSRSECLDFLGRIASHVKDGIATNTAPIVYSPLGSTDFMVECLRAGAADYILQPLHAKEARTMFLNVLRYSLSECGSHRRGRAGPMWAHFQDRLKAVFQRNDSMTRKMVDYYTPEPSVRRSSMQSMTSDRKSYLRSCLSQWKFQPLDLDEYDLVQCVYLILEQALSHPDLAHLRVSTDDMYDFIFDISNAYHRKNPYHNFRHAVDVMQATYYFLCQIGRLTPMDGGANTTFVRSHSADGETEEMSVADLLQPLDVLALLLASIGHDVGHPGVNNVFMVNSGTPLAIMYNDRSVLESFHSMAFFNLLQRHCFHSLTNSREHPEYTMFRRIIVNSILATDMSLHNDYVQQINGQSERIKARQIDLADEEQCNNERILFCSALIKCADISNCARPFAVAERWAGVLAEEFFQQGDLEKELGMSVMPMNNRGSIRLEDFQLTFKRNIAIKLFKAVVDVEADMSFTLDSIHNNIESWERMKSKADDTAKGAAE